MGGNDTATGGSERSEQILDATCGGRSIWHPESKDREDTLYIDIREEAAGFVDQGFNFEANPGYEIAPDEQQDFRDLPYPDESFNLVVFDPPHPIRPGGMAGITGATLRKWGCLHAETWQDDLSSGFSELWRVLRPGGTLVFKFNDESADFRDVLELAPAPPLFGTSVNDGRTETRWFVFYKPEGARNGRTLHTGNRREESS